MLCNIRLRLLSNMYISDFRSHIVSLVGGINHPITVWVVPTNEHICLHLYIHIDSYRPNVVSSVASLCVSSSRCLRPSPTTVLRVAGGRWQQRCGAHLPSAADVAGERLAGANHRLCHARPHGLVNVGKLMEVTQRGLVTASWLPKISGLTDWSGVIIDWFWHLLAIWCHACLSS